MKKLLLILILASSCREPRYYDGEGNEIPQSVVALMVKSQFVIVTPHQDSVLNHYFYFRNK